MIQIQAMRSLLRYATSSAALLITATLLTTACGPKAVAVPEKEQMRSGKFNVTPSPNGIYFPSKYKNWPVLSVGHRLDEKRVQVVVGNRTAIIAARKGQTNPWPDGTIIGNVVYEQKISEIAPNIITTDGFVRAEFMFKDRSKYASNRTGWGWARWSGKSLTPYGDTQDFEEECIKCHRSVSGNDWLHMKPTLLP